ncbi:macrolide export ATP-binding/permease MacB [Klebsiella michiganensis]|uniref:Macrolide export ATP-binding/permease MacB n=1 Tax=Klebsiella michiganensis TaxID=1134687 RepID=A0A7H4MT63_9ENTR|nr:macrolide export ATP-binding/permease MacB [Klebsiella michiganensis]
MDVLHQLNADGHTVIIVTHDREVAQQAQRIVEISDGAGGRRQYPRRA